MGYAISGSSMRAVDKHDELMDGEIFCEELPSPWPPKPSIEQLWLEYQEKAQALLDATDVVCLRCYKAGVPFPAEWLAHTNKLRTIVRASSGDPLAELPVRPEYPAGT